MPTATRNLPFLLVLAFGCAPTHSAAERARSARSPATSEVSLHQAALAAAQEAVRNAEQAASPSDSCRSWPLWERYAERFISEDGRVIDHTSDGRTTSEGQSYALFFALVAGDHARFAKLLAWTEQNLAGGDLGARLPAWHWGKRNDDSYGVIDDNAASDADVWITYALLEAASKFHEPRYGTLARALAARIAEHEIVEVRGLGRVLLPGPRGFVGDRGHVRLNPSYLVLPLFRALEREKLVGPWRAVAESSARVLIGSAPRGLAPNWVAYTPGAGFGVDEQTGALGSYDAIRVYLWSALSAATLRHGRALRESSAGLHALIERTGRVPEHVDVRSAEISQHDGPPGFLAVALADAHARGARELERELHERLARTRHDGLYGLPPSYYDQNLALFALGFVEGRYAFGADGHLLSPKNEAVCATP